MKVVAHTISLFLLMFGISSCGHFRTESFQTVAPGEVSLHITAQYQKTDSIITRVYVYPPLKARSDGAPLEALFHTVDEKGSLVWHAPASESATLQAVLESHLKKRRLRVVPFSEILDPQNGHEILVFNAYYSDAFEKRSQNEAGDRARFVFVRISASTFPSDLAVENKRDVIDVQVLTRFSPLDSWGDALKTSIKQAVSHIGENGQGIESCLISSR